jgi:hypothetical protein
VGLSSPGAVVRLPPRGSPAGAPGAALTGRAREEDRVDFFNISKKCFNNLKNVDENMSIKPTFVKTVETRNKSCPTFPKKVATFCKNID